MRRWLYIFDDLTGRCFKVKRVQPEDQPVDRLVRSLETIAREGDYGSAVMAVEALAGWEQSENPDDIPEIETA